MTLLHQAAQKAVEAPPLTDEQIKAIAQQWFVTGENQLRADGYYYRSLGTVTNVRESDLIAFAREVLARAEAWPAIREAIASDVAPPASALQQPDRIAGPEASLEDVMDAVADRHVSALQQQEVSREPVAAQPEIRDAMLALAELAEASAAEWAAECDADAALERALAGIDYFLTVKPARDFIVGARTELMKLRDAASPSTTRQQEVGSRVQYRHKRTGGLYEVIGTAKLQTDKPLFDMAEVVAYRGEDGRVWVRAAAEFDERFKRAAAPSTPENADGGPHG